MYIHPKKVRIANVSLNPFKNKLAEVDFNIGEIIEKKAITGTV
ncbi:hypothetical protein VDG1235_2024 [Verrucomicrobiia bacterium DG1235]|nr:hypothetical protein VDG1235_2024 [Verrucomicrobiae bacterium DG1235]